VIGSLTVKPGDRPLFGWREVDPPGFGGIKHGSTVTAKSAPSFGSETARLRRAQNPFRQTLLPPKDRNADARAGAVIAPNRLRVVWESSPATGTSSNPEAS